MNEQNQPTSKIEERQKTLGLWVAGIFAALGLVFLLFWVYTVIILQQGKADLADKALMPITVLMLASGAAGYFLIRRDRLVAGLWLVFGVVLVPPVVAVLVLNNIFALGLAYLAVFAPISFTWVFPKPARRQAMIATAAVVLLIIGIQIWNPAFRVRSATLVGFAPYVLAVGGLVFLFLLVRYAYLGNLRTKLLITQVLIAVIASWSVIFFTNQSITKNLTTSIGNNISDLSHLQAVQVGQILTTELDLLNALANTRAVQQRAENGTAASTLNQGEIQALDQQWMVADGANNNNDPLVARVLGDSLSAELLKFKATYPENAEVFLTDLQGLNLASTDRTSDYLQSDENWWQSTIANGQYIGQPEFDASSKTLAVNMGVAVRAPNSERVVGVLRATVNINFLADVLGIGLFGQTGHTSIHLPDGQEIILAPNSSGKHELFVEQADFDINALPASTAKYQTVSIDDEPALVSIAKVTRPGADKGASVITDLDWYVVTHQEQAEALAPVADQTRNSMILATVIAIFFALVSLGLAQLLAGPILRLNAAAEKVAAGDLTVQAKVETHDEIGTLAATFNNMTRQLRDMVSSLESRVAERTHSLELAAEVGRSVSQVRDLDIMLREAVEIIRSRFDLYYAQVYLANPTQTTLTLRSGTGTVGAELTARGHSLPINSASINGRAAVEKRPVVISDTAASPSFHPNALLPDTRSEMAVPLIVNDRVVGVLDMQSDRAGALNQETLPAFEALAGQLAVAIQNANLLEEAEQARAEVEKQAARLSRSQWQDYLDAIHKPEQIGFAYEQNRITPLSGTEAAQPLPSDGSLSAPIAVGGATLGSLAVELDEQSRNPQARELINAVARQVAQQVESLRLLESAERYRAEAEQASRRLTQEGWKEYVATRERENLGFIYDSKEVRPRQDAAEIPSEAPIVAQPIKVREETIGKLAVEGLPADDPDARELMRAVAERLAAHIESLRQFDRAQSALAQSEKLFVASRDLSQANDLQELIAAVAAALDIPEINRAVLATFNYDADNQINSLDIIANWWNGTGTEITPVGTHYPLEVIRAMTLFVSPTPVFFNDTHTDERVDAVTMQLIQRQNLRAVAVLPLHGGSRQIGAVILEAEEPHHFTDEETRLFTALAPQIATVLENRRQFERAQKQAERESTLNLISQKIQSATSVESVLQIAARELGQALGAPLTVAQLGVKERGDGG